MKTWTHVVAVSYEFHTNILFYDGAAGRGDVYRYIDKGQIVHLKSLPNLPKNWTRVVPGVFGGEFWGLLTYDASAGRGDIYRMDG